MKTNPYSVEIRQRGRLVYARIISASSGRRAKEYVLMALNIPIPKRNVFTFGPFEYEITAVKLYPNGRTYCVNTLHLQGEFNG